LPFPRGDNERSHGCSLLRSGLVALLAASVISTPAALGAPSPGHGPTRYAKLRRVCRPPAPGRARCLAVLRKPVVQGAPVPAGARPYTVNTGAASGGPAGGLTPGQLASAYEYDAESGGGGQTVAIVDAYDDPNIEADLATFNEQYGLPGCTSANGCFTKVGQSGKTTSLPAADKTGWSVEIALDVEAVHAACPKCKILLVEANSESFKNLAASVNTAVALGASEISNSYGGEEFGPGSTERAAYNHPGVVITASTGDDGYYDWDWLNEGFPVPEMPDAPASLPSVVAVGGTTLHLASNGARASESVWNNNGPEDSIGGFEGIAEGATGGGCSKLFNAEPWQANAPGFASTGCGAKRLAADVSAVADPVTGFDIYDSYNCGVECEEFGITKGTWLTVGGTSLSSPLVAALYALAGGSSGVRYPALTLYGHLPGESSAPFDVSEGGNGFCGATAGCHPNATFGQVDCEGTTACDAATGYDGPSGVGSPAGLGMFKPLRPSAVITPPSSLAQGTASQFSGASSSDPYPGGSISTYSWSWGDGSPDSGGVAPSHTFASTGVYDVRLTVTDSYGLTSIPSTLPINVTPAVQGSAASVANVSTSPTSTPPNSRFGNLTATLNRRTGAITFKGSVSDRGTFRWLLTFQNGRFGVFASATAKCGKGFVRLKGRCRPSRIAFGKGSKLAAAGVVSFTVRPSASALKALENAFKQRKGVPVTATFTFQSSRGGSAFSRAQSLTIRLKKK
jgi:PKD domain